jgi:hypothetical protein
MNEKLNLEFESVFMRQMQCNGSTFRALIVVTTVYEE